MGKHVASTQIKASPDKVWAVISDGNRLPEWLSPVGGVDKIEPAGALAPGTKIEANIGKVGGAKINIKEADAGRLLKWSGGPFLAHMMRMPMQAQLDLEGSGDSTTATITFKSNPMMAPIMGMMTGLKFDEEALKTMEALKATVEKG